MDKETSKALKVAKAALEEHKALDINVIEVSSLTPFDDYFLIATALNPRHLGSLVDQIEEALEKEGLGIGRKDGHPESGWIVLEAHGVLIHLFLADTRGSVGLEELLSHAKAKEA